MNQAFWDLLSADSAANCKRWERLPTPAIHPGGGGWRRTSTANPSFLHFGDRLLLYYRGTGTAVDDAEERDQIGAAEVVQIGRRGIVVDELADSPVIASGGPTAFDAEALDPSPLAFKGEVLLYYSALGPGEDSIGLATSRDGVTFDKCGQIMTGRAPAAVVRNGNVGLLSQEKLGDGYGLRLYASRDGKRFEPAALEPVFVPEAGAWDGLSVVTARLFEDGEWIYMLYGGSSERLDEPKHFGLARSRDLLHWERHPGNPIFEAGQPGAPDGGYIWFPAITETREGFAMIYEGSRGTPEDEMYSICLAFLGK